MKHEKFVQDPTISTPEAAERTLKMKKHVQQIVVDALGVNVPIETAWTIYQGLIHGTAEFVLHDPEHYLPIPGIGVFMVEKGKADYKGLGYSPMYRWYPSTHIDERVRNHFTKGQPQFAASGTFSPVHTVLATDDTAKPARLGIIPPPTRPTRASRGSRTAPKTAAQPIQDI